MNDTDKAYWLADKIPAYGDYPKEAAMMLKRQADEILKLREIEAAARNLVAQKGRHHTQQAYQRLAALVVPNAKLRGATDD